MTAALTPTLTQPLYSKSERSKVLSTLVEGEKSSATRSNLRRQCEELDLGVARLSWRAGPPPGQLGGPQSRTQPPPGSTDDAIVKGLCRYFILDFVFDYHAWVEA